MVHHLHVLSLERIMQVIVSHMYSTQARQLCKRVQCRHTASLKRVL